MDGNRPVQVTGTGSTREEAIRNREANKQKRLIQIGELPPSALKPNQKQAKRTVALALEEWIDWKSSQTLRSQKISLNVQASYRTMIEKHLIPAIGSKALRALNKADLEQLFFTILPRKKNGRGERLLGESRLRTMQLMLRLMLDCAVDRKYIYENPMKVNRPGFYRVPRVVFSANAFA
jgi:hypothetical protein